MSVAVEFHEIVKSFGSVRVLHSVSFALEPDRIYALIGENGAGKSTLMKILAGYEAPSGGELRINGRAVHFSGSRAAEAEGIVLVCATGRQKLSGLARACRATMLAQSFHSGALRREPTARTSPQCR